ncbi:hypothetical protein F4677DRAFT_460058 [Hypoxylon crocopeplum]|nr:hypothetical protein F4677DRAFT_460058 [Hypoxylon crocopeplum]
MRRAEEAALATEPQSYADPASLRASGEARERTLDQDIEKLDEYHTQLSERITDLNSQVLRVTSAVDTLQTNMPSKEDADKAKSEVITILRTLPSKDIAEKTTSDIITRALAKAAPKEDSKEKHESRAKLLDAFKEDLQASTDAIGGIIREDQEKHESRAELLVAKLASIESKLADQKRVSELEGMVAYYDEEVRKLEKTIADLRGQVEDANEGKAFADGSHREAMGRNQDYLESRDQIIQRLQAEVDKSKRTVDSPGKSQDGRPSKKKRTASAWESHVHDLTTLFKSVDVMLDNSDVAPPDSSLTLQEVTQRLMDICPEDQAIAIANMAKFLDGAALDHWYCVHEFIKNSKLVGSVSGRCQSHPRCFQARKPSDLSDGIVLFRLFRTPSQRRMSNLPFVKRPGPGVSLK